ncbi:hypothetical protein Q604_UNBC00789G0001, partial [human gut metagenome]
EPTQADTPAPGEGAATGDAQTRLDTALVDARSAMTAANEAMKNGDWTAYGEAQTRLNDALNRAVAAQEELKK